MPDSNAGPVTDVTFGLIHLILTLPGELWLFAAIVVLGMVIARA